MLYVLVLKDPPGGDFSSNEDFVQTSDVTVIVVSSDGTTANLEITVIGDESNPLCTGEVALGSIA